MQRGKEHAVKNVGMMMVKYLAAMAAVFGLFVAPAFAAGETAEPTRLSDAELDQVSAGDPLILVNIPVNVAAFLNVHVEPITVNVPVNVAAIVQANVLGNGVFDGVAVGTQNVFQAASNLQQTAATLKPGG
jgi:hypothetical protein